MNGIAAVAPAEAIEILPIAAMEKVVVGHGFVPFLVSSPLWAGVGVAHCEPSLVVLQGAFSAINVIGIYRWLAVWGRRRTSCKLTGIREIWPSWWIGSDFAYVRIDSSLP